MKDATREALRYLLVDGLQPQGDHQDLSSAAVLLALFSKNGADYLVLNKRTTLVEHHKGEICFPGGVEDPQDADHLATALREAQEEMGIAPEDVELLGELDPITTGSHFLIRPVVGLVPYPYPFKINETEIAQVLEVPVSTLLDPRNRREERSLRHGVLEVAYSYAYHGHIIYGATARILTRFLGLFVQALNKETAWTSLPSTAMR